MRSLTHNRCQRSNRSYLSTFCYRIEASVETSDALKLLMLTLTMLFIF